jgi:hypothetical protein
MPPTLRRLAVSFIALGLLFSGAPAADAGSLKTLKVKTVTIKDRPVRFVLAVDGKTAYVLMKFRRDGKWRTVASDKTDCKYFPGSHDPSLQVQKADRQVLIGWFGPTEDRMDEYGGYNVKRRTVDMFGAGSCPPAG